MQRHGAHHTRVFCRPTPIQSGRADAGSSAEVVRSCSSASTPPSLPQLCLQRQQKDSSGVMLSGFQNSTAAVLMLSVRLCVQMLGRQEAAAALGWVMLPCLHPTIALTPGFADRHLLLAARPCSRGLACSGPSTVLNRSVHADAGQAGGCSSPGVGHAHLLPPHRHSPQAQARPLLAQHQGSGRTRADPAASWAASRTRFWQQVPVHRIRPCCSS